MNGIIDVGGGMRGVYGSGVLDRCLDEGVSFDVCVGVSAGSANLASFLAGQKERNYRFYTDHSRDKRYMSLANYRKTGSFFGLDYIYSTLTNEIDPIDYDNLLGTKSRFYVTATDAETGKVHCFSNSDFQRNNCEVLKASCAIPILCKPIKIGEKEYFDGGTSEPVPIDMLEREGCDKIAAILTLPRSFVKKPEMLPSVYKRLMHKYPKIIEDIAARHIKYAEGVKKITELEAAGRAVVLAPENLFGVNTTVRTPEKLKLLYQQGYNDGAKLVKRFG